MLIMGYILLYFIKIVISSTNNVKLPKYYIIKNTTNIQEYDFIINDKSKQIILIIKLI